MNEEKQELRYRQAGVAGTEWSVATTPDEFMQNGVYEIKVISDNGTLPFPFRFAGDDIAKLIVSDSGTNGKQQTNRIVVQTITITPSGTNKSITYTRTRRSVNGNQQWSSWVEPEAASTANIYDGSITAEKLSDDIRPNAVSPLRPLFIAAGAEYNDTGVDKTKKTPWGETVTHKAGHYYLNALGDITENQMIDIYNAGHFEMKNDCVLDKYMLNNCIRTIIPAPCVYIGSYNIISLEKSFYGCTSVETICFAKPSSNFLLKCKSLRVAFQGLSSLRYIMQPIDLSQVAGSRELESAFSNCDELKLVYLKNLAVSINMSYCANISLTSILFMINNAAPASAITITLHPDAYARLAEDADIVAALETQPLVSLVSA